MYIFIILIIAAVLGWRIYSEKRKKRNISRLHIFNQHIFLTEQCSKIPAESVSIIHILN